MVFGIVFLDHRSMRVIPRCIEIVIEAAEVDDLYLVSISCQFFQSCVMFK